MDRDPFCRLDQHIRWERTFRYSAGCRDVTARIGQGDVALASALFARQVRSADDHAAQRSGSRKPMVACVELRVRYPK